MYEEKKQAKKALTDTALDAVEKALPIVEEAVNKMVKYFKEATERKLKVIRGKIGEKNESPK
jgi:Na+/phosphate symporter